MSSFWKSKFVFVLIALITLVSCNKASLEPQLQGSWDGTAPGWTQVSFSSGSIVLRTDPKTLLQGSYKLEGKTLTFDLFENVTGKQIRLSEPATAAIEKLDANSLELNLKGQRMQFFKNNP